MQRGASGIQPSSKATGTSQPKQGPPSGHLQYSRTSGGQDGRTKMKDRKAHTHSRDVQPTHLRRNPQQAHTKSHRRDDEPLQESFPPQQTAHGRKPHQVPPDSHWMRRQGQGEQGGSHVERAVNHRRVEKFRRGANPAQTMKHTV